MKVSNLVLKGYQLLTDEETADLIFVGIYVSDLLSNVLRQAKPENGLVTTLTNMNTIAVASMLDLAMVIFSEGKMPSQEMISKANQEGIALLSSHKMAHEIVIDLHPFE